MSTIPIILDVVDVAQDVADFIKSIDDSANADTPIVWGNVVSGDCWYYYVDENGERTRETAKFSFSTSVSDGYMLVIGEHFSVIAKRLPNTSGTAPTLSIYSEGFYWDGQQYYNQIRNINGHETEFSGAVFIDRRNYSYTFFSDGSTSSSSPPPVYAGSISDVSFTTMSGASASYPDAVYLPISGQSLSYNDMRENLVVYANNIILSETDTDGETVYNESDTITIYDLPEFETEPETESETDPTEPDYQPVSINYDEILSEDELESILNQESYNIPEIESISETVIIDIEDLVIEDDTEYRKIMEFVPDALAAGMSIFNELNIAMPLTSAAIVACIWKIIKGG